MCIVFWTLRQDPKDSEYTLVLAFNRDEYFERPTVGFHLWEGSDIDIYAPKDLRPPIESYRGSWLGVNRHGRLAFLTNYREQVYHHKETISRGALVRDFLFSGSNPGDEAQCKPADIMDYAQMVYKNRHKYDGFNLVLLDLRPGHTQAIYVTNRDPKTSSSVNVDMPEQGGLIKVLDTTGIAQGLSNSTILDPWPKVLRGIDSFGHALESANLDSEKDTLDAIAPVMKDSSPYSSSRLPQRLKDLEECIFVPQLEKPLSANSEPGIYGTRTTDILLLRGNRLTIAEYNHDAASISGDIPNERKFSYFDISA
ncbi:hypothetical protein GGI25_001692 [Coemansia spiralis]|uniref:Uncharacterized protein n=1 Tax=Coemansia spiralis TaxID=417178 RepID=A0A9W8G4Z9_9FUNG|nr:NRDE protein-domain-containing protein [Coemansia spiralis]KAJ2624968.1 hypothetical protein GGI26_001080 [Coemansia sp. RSA 1358]KAJ2679124.1 hypothetical protein GGI25_001692 [Coemansia spiralis]